MDTAALDRLLGIVLSREDYEYGGSASAALMDKLFMSYEDSARSAPLSERPSADRILSIAKTLEDRTLTQGDTIFFKHLEGDLLYWLTSRRDEICKEGTIPFINEYVLSRPGIWNTPEDTLKVVGLSRMMKDLLSRTPVGFALPKAKTLARMADSAVTSSSAFPAKDWNRVLRKGGYIVFHTEGCPVCKSELSAADSLGLRIVDVNIDEIMASNPPLAKVLLDSFDLSSMPLIIEVSRHGTVRRRYLSFLPR